MMGTLSQCQVNQRGNLARHRQHVGDQTQYGAPRPRIRLFQQDEQFPPARAESLVAAFQPLQHLDPAGQAAAFGAQVSDPLTGFLDALAQSLAFVA